MTNHENSERWRLTKINDIVMNVDKIMAAQKVVVKTAEDYPYAVIQTTAKAIINMREVLLLLSYGYPDGALSRGRNIFEQAVILRFLNINKNSNGNELMQRYYDDYQVKRISNLIDVQNTFISEGNELIPGVIAHRDALQQELNSLKQKYKIKGYPSQYWWADTVIPRASFNKIMNETDYELLKILYKRACISTHASAIGDFALLGRDNPAGNKIFTSPTFEGFECPIVLSVESFSLILEYAFDLITYCGDDIRAECRSIVNPLILKMFR